MRADLPSGTVTFVFTDIEGSTRLLHELGDAYAGVLAEHRRILRESAAAHGGVEVDTQGDAFFFAFARALDAVEAARVAQNSLAASPTRVRMGIHTGQPILTHEGYVGRDVHRGARIAAADIPPWSSPMRPTPPRWLGPELALGIQRSLRASFENQRAFALAGGSPRSAD